MTLKTRAQISDDADTYIPDNSIGAITAAGVRNRIKDLADSTLFSTDVTQFGAVGDGVTDDTVAIQAAIDSMKPAATTANSVSYGGMSRVYFPAGNYLISEPILIYSGQWLQGVGSGSRITAETGVFPDNGRMFETTKADIAGSGYYQNARISDLWFSAEGGSGIWAIGHGADIEVGANFIWQHLLFTTPKGVDLDPYSQFFLLEDLFFVGETDQMIHCVGSFGRIDRICKEASTGSTSDPYVLVEASLGGGSGGISFSNVLIEGATSSNKACMDVRDVINFHLENSHFEAQAGTDVLLVLENCAGFEITGALGVLGGADQVINITDGSWGTVTMGNSDPVWDTVFQIDETSHVQFNRIGGTIGSDLYKLDDAHKFTLGVGIATNLIELPIEGISPYSTYRNAASENLLVNPSFEAGIYGWGTYAGSINTWDAGYTYAISQSEVGFGLMLDMTAQGATNAFFQRIAVPAAWIGRNMTFSYLAKVVGGTTAICTPYITSTTGPDHGTGGRNVTAGSGWQLASVTFRPQAAGNLDIGLWLLAATAGVSHLYVDKMRLGFGTDGEVAGGSFKQLELGSTSHTIGTAAPTVGTWKRGDIVWNSTPSSGGTMGWMCVTAGTPGTWSAMPNLA